jgi:transcriptional regulator with XRE-family HTH domain
MKLSAYLALNEVSDADFAAAVGVERQAVHRYKSGLRFPAKSVLTRIFEHTGGQVTANDFCDFGDQIMADSEPESAA